MVIPGPPPTCTPASPASSTASGTAELSPRDPYDVPEIGFELAAGRALIALGELLVGTGRADLGDALVGSDPGPPDRGRASVGPLAPGPPGPMPLPGPAPPIDAESNDLRR